MVADIADLYPNLRDWPFTRPAALVEAAPDNAHGPYLLGRRERKYGHYVWDPVWVPEYEVMDYLFSAWWYPKGVLTPPKWGQR